jgi:tRNA G18 (ribose-2'-O)-methylase SpoU
MPEAAIPIAVRITDPADGRVDDYRRLADPRARRRMEASDGGAGFFVAEGVHSVRRLLLSGHRVRSVLVDPNRLESLAVDLLGLAAPVLVAERSVLQAVAGFDVHRGALAAADRWPLPDPAALLPAARRVAVLEGINDHENLGVIFRNAAGLGIDAVFLCPRCCDPLYRRSVRVSMGHVLSVPWARLDPWPGGLDLLRHAGFALVALAPGPGAQPLTGYEAAPSERIAVLLGAEGPGLTGAVLALADRRLCIPMSRGVDSLNVASAAAVAFHQITTATSTTKSISSCASTGPSVNMLHPPATAES